MLDTGMRKIHGIYSILIKRFNKRRTSQSSYYLYTCLVINVVRDITAILKLVLTSFVVGKITDDAEHSDFEIL